MARTVDIRPMRHEDLADIFRLGSRLCAGGGNPIRPWSREVLAGLLAEGLELSRVARVKKKLTAFLIGIINGPQAAILWIGADPSGAGVQERLIESFIEGLAGKNIDSLRIEIPSINSPLIDLCRKIGFTEIGHVISMERILTKL